MASDQYVKLQGRSFDWLIGLVFLLVWLENEAALHSFPANFESKLNKILDVYFATTG
jgi:hypothetical protein